MGNLNQAYEEVAIFLASLDPNKLLELKPSKDILERVEEHLIALAKAQARIQLQAA